MTDNLLTKIKKGKNITGTYQDDTLQIHIDEVKAFMLSAGVSQAVIDSDKAVGCILRGVSDLWEGDSLSSYFKMRVQQLRKEKVETEEGEPNGL